VREAEAAGNTSDVNVNVDVDQQLLIESAGGNSLPDLPLPAVPFPNVPLPNVPPPEALPDGWVGEE
jgi:hypothetical protein